MRITVRSRDLGRIVMDVNAVDGGRHKCWSVTYDVRTGDWSFRSGNTTRAMSAHSLFSIKLREACEEYIKKRSDLCGLMS